MARKICRLFTRFLIAIAATSVAFAQPSTKPAPSLEWLAMTSQIVIRGQITKVVPTKDRNGAEWQIVTVRVSETLKGTASDEVTFADPLHWRSGPSRSAEWRDRHADLLLFLARRGNEVDKFPEHPFSPNYPEDDALIDLGERPLRALPMDLHQVSSAEELLALMRAATKAPWALGFSFRIPYSSSAPDSNLRPYWGSVVTVPKDDRLEAAAKQWLKGDSAELKATAISALAPFKSDANASFIRTYLTDPGTAPTAGPGDPPKSVAFPAVRHMAQDVLDEWGYGWESPNPLQFRAMQFCLVPGGKFSVGPSEVSDARPPKIVQLPTFAIGSTDVTVGEFRAFCKATGYRFDWKGLRPRLGWKENHPMVNVTWDEARRFCKWAGGDLASGAQWEAAARGSDGRLFPWGSKWDASRLQDAEQAQVSEFHETAPVGRFPSGKSPYGCLDMEGNVRCWCLDAAEGGKRQVRGGSWRNWSSQDFRVTRISSELPSLRADDLGFRVVMVR